MSITTDCVMQKGLYRIASVSINGKLFPIKEGTEKVSTTIEETGSSHDNLRGTVINNMLRSAK